MEKWTRSPARRAAWVGPLEGSGEGSRERAAARGNGVSEHWTVREEENDGLAQKERKGEEAREKSMVMERGRARKKRRAGRARGEARECGKYGQDGQGVGI